MSLDPQVAFDEEKIVGLVRTEREEKGRTGLILGEVVKVLELQLMIAPWHQQSRYLPDIVLYHSRHHCFCVKYLAKLSIASRVPPSSRLFLMSSQTRRTFRLYFSPSSPRILAQTSLSSSCIA